MFQKYQHQLLLIQWFHYVDEIQHPLIIYIKVPSQLYIPWCFSRVTSFVSLSSIIIHHLHHGSFKLHATMQHATQKIYTNKILAVSLDDLN